tara:strand:- start:758 stop:1015 length:258 start_codon:yes stop_codon:yes gene_type:complete
MNYFVYLIATIKNDKVVSYVGYTNNIKKRLALHNTGKGAKFTRGSNWQIIYKKKYTNKKEAMSEEFKLKKNYKLRNKIKLKLNYK